MVFIMMVIYVASDKCEGRARHLEAGGERGVM
jgi:hypothetical protein